jgi:HSP20 family protein
MSVVRYRPWKTLGMMPGFHDTPARFGRLLEEVLGTDARDAIGWSPAMDIVEDDGALRLTAELPGMKQEDVQIEVHEGVLTLRGEKKSEKEETKGSARLLERTYGAFERSFTLPRSVEADHIEAEFADGVLTVNMPKTEKAAGRKIAIAAK